MGKAHHVSTDSNRVGVLMRTCSTAVPTAIHHEVDVPTCCPVSRNPIVGSRLRVSYRPAGIVLPVEDLRDMLAEYVGGHADRSIRNMEEMIQDVAQRVSDIVNVTVYCRAGLVIVPHGGGEPQVLRVSCRAMAHHLAPHLAGGGEVEPVLGTEYRRVIRRGDGRFFQKGCDSPDRWVVNPLDASDVGGLGLLRDVRQCSTDTGAIVEIEVSARLTGFTEAHLYHNGEYVDPRQTSQEGENGDE